MFLKVPSYFPGVFTNSESSEILPWRFYKFRKFRATSLEFLQIPKVPRYFPGVFTSSEIELWQKFELFILMFSDFIYCFFYNKKARKSPRAYGLFGSGFGRAGPGKSPPGGRALQARPVARPITKLVIEDHIWLKPSLSTDLPSMFFSYRSMEY